MFIKSKQSHTHTQNTRLLWRSSAEHSEGHPACALIPVHIQMQVHCIGWEDCVRYNFQLPRHVGSCTPSSNWTITAQYHFHNVSKLSSDTENCNHQNWYHHMNFKGVIIMQSFKYKKTPTWKFLPSPNMHQRSIHAWSRQCT